MTEPASPIEPEPDGAGGLDDGVEEHVLTFPDGIPGFPDARRFVLTDLVEDGAFQILQSIDHPDLSMVVGVPWLFFPDYAPIVPDADQRELELGDAEDAVIFCSVTVPEDDDSPPTMNLLGPFIVNRHTRVGRQIVLEADESALRVPLSLGV